MTGSLKLTNAAAYQDYVQDNTAAIVSKLYYGFKTSAVATPHEGLKARKPITEMILGSLIQIWKAAWNPTADAVDFNVRELQPKHFKVDLGIYPAEFAETYLGVLRRDGISPDELPFASYFIDKVAAKMRSEMQTASWSGDATATTSGTLLGAFVNGYETIIKDAIVATDLTAVVTGAITSANAIAKVELMHDALSDPFKQDEVDLGLFCSPSVAKKIRQNYASTYAGATTQAMTSIPTIPNLTIYPMAGITGDFMVITPPSNLHYSYAVEGEQPLDFESFRRELSVMADGWIDFQIGILHDDLVAANDQ